MHFVLAQPCNSIRARVVHSFNELILLSSATLGCVVSLSCAVSPSSPTSLRALDGGPAVMDEAQQVFRLSTAQDNVHLVHIAKNVATQASLINLAKPKEAALVIYKIHQPVERFQAGAHRPNSLQEAVNVLKVFGSTVTMTPPLQIRLDTLTINELS